MGSSKKEEKTHARIPTTGDTEIPERENQVLSNGKEEIKG